MSFEEDVTINTLVDNFGKLKSRSSEVELSGEIQSTLDNLVDQVAEEIVQDKEFTDRIPAGSDSDELEAGCSSVHDELSSPKESDNTTVDNGQPAVPIYTENIASPATSRLADESLDEFWLKTVDFEGASRRIVMQSLNGPCPLIAAVNALLLKGILTIPARERAQPTITRRDLTELIGTRLLAVSTDCLPEQRKDFEKTLSDLLNILPELGTGLEVNLRFRSVSSFEYTTSIALFDLLGLNLYHTWVVEAGSEYYDAVGSRTYNEVTTLATENIVLRDFLDETRTQMTYTGLFDVRDAMKHGEMAILFRNNHFQTLHKRENELFVLCTDVGFLQQPEVVWEVLQNIEGDSRWVNGSFKTAQPTEQAATASNEATPISEANDTSVTVDEDFEYARRLQEEMDRVAIQQSTTNPSTVTTQLPAHLRSDHVANVVNNHQRVDVDRQKKSCVLM